MLPCNCTTTATEKTRERLIHGGGKPRKGKETHGADTLPATKQNKIKGILHCCRRADRCLSAAQRQSTGSPWQWLLTFKNFHSSLVYFFFVPESLPGNNTAAGFYVDPTRRNGRQARLGARGRRAATTPGAGEFKSVSSDRDGQRPPSDGFPAHTRRPSPPLPAPGARRCPAAARAG
jgi:hypothetical protein